MQKSLFNLGSSEPLIHGILVSSIQILKIQSFFHVLQTKRKTLHQVSLLPLLFGMICKRLTTLEFNQPQNAASSLKANFKSAKPKSFVKHAIQVEMRLPVHSPLKLLVSNNINYFNFLAVLHFSSNTKLMHYHHVYMVTTLKVLQRISWKTKSYGIFTKVKH